jgi:hypothetical protein
MKNKMSLLTILLFANLLLGQVKIIFDTDIGGDADDLGALAMLHNFIDNGECKLLAIGTFINGYSVEAVDAINRYYNHPNIPIGACEAELFFADWHYNNPIVEKFPYELTYEKAKPASRLYREVLANQPDSSVTFVTVGPLINIKNLLASGPDSISPLSGKKLVHKKVKEFVIMGGKFPQGKKEWNFDGGMKGVTKYVLANLDLPITFSGYEIGVSIKTGEVFNDIDKDTPLYVGFYHFSKFAPWMKEYFKGKILDNSSYDQTAVLYAVRGGLNKWWTKVEGGYCAVEDNGDNKWIEGKKTNHSYLKLLEEPETMAKLIENIMLGNF